LRYVLFTERGTLKGLLTKKDVWYVMNGMEEDREEGGAGVGVGRGGLREEREGMEDDNEERGLLGTPEDEHGSFVGGDRNR
jgi:chloride channel 3/4/5